MLLALAAALALSAAGCDGSASEGAVGAPAEPEPDPEPPAVASGAGVVGTHGRLQVDGNRIVDRAGNAVSLAGNSLFWSNAGDLSDFYAKRAVEHVAEDWNSSIIRIAMGVNEDWDGGQGYIGSPALQKEKVRTVVEAALDVGIYVIIDWHSHEAEAYTEEAVAFFTEMARRYGDTPNVIYEIYNEPIDQSWPTIKSYAEEVIAGIRSEDPDNLIVVGTPFYSQQVDVAAAAPLGDPNVAYTVHFYAATHGEDLRNRVRAALDQGVAVFATEWGAVEADGGGAPDADATRAWMDFLRRHEISHANWHLGDKGEGAAAVESGAGIDGLVNDRLTPSGALVKRIIEDWSTPR